MKIISNETQKLAALAVFGALYDAKKDIYSVLCEFIKQIFVIKGLHSIFSVEGLREELVSQFGFDNILYIHCRKFNLLCCRNYIGI